MGGQPSITRDMSPAPLILLTPVLGSYMLLLWVCMKKMVDQSMKILYVIVSNN
jgi:hypothetical protein